MVLFPSDFRKEYIETESPNRANGTLRFLVKEAADKLADNSLLDVSTRPRFFQQLLQNEYFLLIFHTF